MANNEPNVTLDEQGILISRGARGEKLVSTAQLFSKQMERQKRAQKLARNQQAQHGLCPMQPGNASYRKHQPNPWMG